MNESEFVSYWHQCIEMFDRLDRNGGKISIEFLTWIFCTSRWRYWYNRNCSISGTTRKVPSDISEYNLRFNSQVTFVCNPKNVLNKRFRTFRKYDEDESGALSFGECFCLIPELEKEAVKSSKPLAGTILRKSKGCA